VVKKVFFRYWFPVIVCALAIFILSLSAIPQEIGLEICPDKIFHFSAYAALAFLFFRAFYNTGARPAAGGPAVRAFGAVFAYGALMEICQLLLPYRSLEILDIFFNTAGALSGVLFFNFRKRK
jgi:VanZ family protein